MKTLKKITFIITIAVVGIALLPSCSKEPQKGAKKGKNAPVAAKGKVLSPNDEKHTFKAGREGQYVNLNWNIEEAGKKIDKIEILRNATGVKKQMRTVGVVTPEATSFRDCLPDANACWYWLRVSYVKDKQAEIGPVKVESDRQGSAGYIKPEDRYGVVVTRTDEIATLKWEFPDEEYKSIQIARYSTPAEITYLASKNIKLKTLAGRSQFSDALSDPNSDYWYWFRITLKSGAMIYKGPIKAEYAQTKR